MVKVYICKPFRYSLYNPNPATEFNLLADPSRYVVPFKLPQRYFYYKIPLNFPIGFFWWGHDLLFLPNFHFFNFLIDGLYQVALPDDNEVWPIAPVWVKNSRGLCLFKIRRVLHLIVSVFPYPYRVVYQYEVSIIKHHLIHLFLNTIPNLLVGQLL